MVRRFALILLACSASLAAAQTDLKNNTSQQDCNSVVSKNDELNMCNQDLVAGNDCSFTDVGGALESASVDDSRVLHFSYTSCTAKGDGDPDCKTLSDVMVMGQAVMVLDGMLIQRQTKSAAADGGDGLCFVYDQESGKAPTPECKVHCFSVATDMGVEHAMETSEVNGLPGYGSFGQDRTFTLLKESERSGGEIIGQQYSFLVGVVGALLVSLIW